MIFICENKQKQLKLKRCCVRRAAFVSTSVEFGAGSSGDVLQPGAVWGVSLRAVILFEGEFDRHNRHLNRSQLKNLDPADWERREPPNKRGNSLKR